MVELSGIFSGASGRICLAIKLNYSLRKPKNMICFWKNSMLFRFLKMLGV